MAETPALITTPDTLRTLVNQLAGSSRLAMDTEAASFHRYVDRVYLVQVSSDSHTAIIDPLAVHDLAPIGAILADPAVEKIFHDADYDLRMLDRDYGFRARRLWDTRIAAQLAGETAFGLGALLLKYFKVTLSKKYQRADWSERPLTEGMLAYAAADTAHLPALRDLLQARLKELGRLAWAEEEFVRLEDLRWPAGDDEHGSLRLKGARQLRGPALGVLRAVWEWREAQARAMDRATFRVMMNEAIIGLARAQPRDAAALVAAGVPASIARRYGSELLAQVERGLAMPSSEWPTWVRQPRPKADPQLEERVNRLKALRAARAQQVALDPGLVCPNNTLMAIARVLPVGGTLDQVPELRRWQREIMGDAAMAAAVAG